MCGIAGLIGVGKTVSASRVMLEKIGHRGPDGLFYWHNEDVAFGHARLSIIDLSQNANQPMTDPETGNVIIFNGEIYNYVELRAEIGNRYHFITNSDTETILAAYRVYGTGFVTRLRGMFAFALYDKQSRRTFLARDRFGIKPLYYRAEKDVFSFSSEIKSLLKPNCTGEEINAYKAYEFLANCQLDCDERTMFNGIFQLSPASHIWVDHNGEPTAPESFWEFPQPGKAPFNEKAKEALLELFADTVKLHLRSDVPVGSFLSGGIDSSSVTCFAMRMMGEQPLHTFSAVLPYYHPENILIEDVLEAGTNLVPHKFSLSGENFFNDIFNVIYHHDEPVMDGSMYAHYKLCQIARNHGVKVVLSGSGGDELFGGYASHVHAQHAKLLSGLKLASWAKEIRQVAANSEKKLSELFLKSVYESLPVSLRRKFKNRQLKSRISHVGVEYPVKHYYHAHRDAYMSNLVNNYRSWTAPPFLHYEDRNSMAAGVEARVPFFDHELVEFILRFSSADIIRGRSKNLLRESFKGIVPDKVLQQKGKYGFPSPIDHSLKTDERGKELFYDLYKSTPLLNHAETEKLADRFYNANGDVSVFWRTFSFIIWYHIFFKQLKQA